MQKNTQMRRKLIGLGLGIGLALGPLQAGAAATPMEGADIAAGAKWGACINVQATGNSEVFEFLSQVIAHERLDHLAARAYYEWSVDLDRLETISVYGADENWDTVTLVARGDFSAVDFSTVPQNEALPRHGKYSIYRYAPLDHINLLFAKSSDKVLVGADTIEGVKRALDVLDGKHASYAQVADQPQTIRRQLAASDCVIGLNVEELKRELNLKSTLLNSTSQAWFSLMEDGDWVEANILMDHASGEAATQGVHSLEKLFQHVFETSTTPPVILEFLDALSSRAEGNWVTARATGSAYEMVELLGGLQDLLNGH